MKRTTIKELYDSADSFGGKEITVSGWCRSIRTSSSAFGFLTLNDGSCFKNLQVVIEADKISNYQDVAKQNVGASFTVVGILTITPDAKQPFELKAEAVTVEGVSSPDYPLQNKRHSYEFLRSIANLRPRANTFNAVFRVRSELAFASAQILHERGSLCSHPLITTSD